MTLLLDIFKEYLPLKDIYKTSELIYSHAIGGTGIALSFLALGLIFIFYTRQNNIEKTLIKQRILASKFVGWSLIICSISRIVEVICIWHNYAIINGILKDVTALLGILTLGYIPYILRLIKRQLTLDQVKKTMDTTIQKIEEVKKLGEDLK